MIKVQRKEESNFTGAEQNEIRNIQKELVDPSKSFSLCGVAPSNLSFSKRPLKTWKNSFQGKVTVS